MIDHYNYNLIYIKNINRVNYSHLYYIVFSHLIKLLFLINNIIIINYYLVIFNFIYRLYFEFLINKFKYTPLI